RFREIGPVGRADAHTSVVQPSLRGGDSPAGPHTFRRFTGRDGAVEPPVLLGSRAVCAARGATLSACPAPMQTCVLRGGEPPGLAVEPLRSTSSRRRASSSG